MKVDFKNNIGVIRELKVGFSWTLLFFGGIPFFFRGMPVHAISVIIASIFSGGIVNIIMAFIGNKMTARHYLENGYAPFSGRWDVAAREWGVHLENIPTDFGAVDDVDIDSNWNREKILATSAIIVAVIICIMLAVRFYDKKRQEENPIQLTEPTRDTTCSLDGMTLVDYPGPKGQIHYASGEVSWFCDTTELVSIYLKPEQQKTIRAALVQDMGKTSWDKPQGNWIDATKAFYVQGSKKHGSMGPTLATFGAQADADKFVAENGGKVLKFGELTPDMVRLDGGMQHDQHM